MFGVLESVENNELQIKKKKKAFYIKWVESCVSWRDVIFCLKLSYYFIITVQWRWNLKLRDIIIHTFSVNFDKMYEQEQMPV